MVALVGLLLAGCQTPPVVEAVPVTSVLSSEQQQERFSPLLAQAERALHDDRLMRPFNHNAYDLYRAVLMLDPSNSDALSGLQLIQVRYIELGRLALGRSSWDEARRYLNRARLLEEQSPLVLEFERQLRVEHQRWQESGRTEGRSVVKLQPQWLATRPDESAPLVSTLDTAAQRILGSQESLLIIARNDAEGRWLYKRIKSRLRGYRLRGDIRVEAEPRLVFAPSLD